MRVWGLETIIAARIKFGRSIISISVEITVVLLYFVFPLRYMYISIAWYIFLSLIFYWAVATSRVKAKNLADTSQTTADGSKLFGYEHITMEESFSNLFLVQYVWFFHNIFYSGWISKSYEAESPVSGRPQKKPAVIFVHIAYFSDIQLRTAQGGVPWAFCSRILHDQALF